MAEGRLVITGAGGFLGTHLCTAASERNLFKEVIAITLGADIMRSQCKNLKNIRIFSEDALQTGEVKLGREDLLVNCAYPRAMQGTDITSGLDYIESVFQKAASENIRGIINISSQSVYDPQRKKPASERDVPCLVDVYAVGKYSIEILLRNVCKDIPYTNIRLASLIGPGFDVRVPNKMIKFAVETGTITALDNDQRFGYLDVEDAAGGILGLLAADPHSWEKVYNLGPHDTVSLVELAELIKNLLHDEYKIDITVNRKKGEQSSNSAVDSSLLVKEIGEFRRFLITDSLRKIISHTIS